MDTVIVKALGYFIGLLLGGSLLTLIVKVTLFFGELRTAVATLTKWMEKTMITLEDHGQRILILEEKRTPDQVGRFEPPREARR